MYAMYGDGAPFLVRCSVCKAIVCGRSVGGRSCPEEHDGAGGITCLGSFASGRKVTRQQADIQRRLPGGDRAVGEPTPAAIGHASISELLCEWCGSSFVPSHDGDRFCAPHCRRAANGMNPRRTVRACFVCGRQFESKGGAYRCRQCRHGSARGRYVYAWYEDDAIFYVGIGRGQRGVARHMSQGTLAPCERHRRKIGNRFSARIVRDNLTSEGARLIEAVLISLLRPKYNKMGGHKRRERPPLSWPS